MRRRKIWLLVAQGRYGVLVIVYQYWEHEPLMMFIPVLNGRKRDGLGTR
jgi:hypothetical protein